MIHFSIEPEYKKLNIEELLENAVEATLAYQGDESCDLSIVLTGDKKIRKLNKQFRGIDQPTDVLSFPTETKAKGPRYLGDVIISVQRGKEQAKKTGHLLDDELVLLAIHGVLHLLGYDHDAPVAKAKMWEAQNEILGTLGINLDVDLAVEAYSRH